MDSLVVNSEFLIRSFEMGVGFGHSLAVYGSIALFAAVAITFLMRF